MDPGDVDILAVGLRDAVVPPGAQARQDRLERRAFEQFDMDPGLGELLQEMLERAPICSSCASVSPPRGPRKPRSASQGPEAVVSGWTSGPP